MPETNNKDPLVDDEKYVPIIRKKKGILGDNLLSREVKNIDSIKEESDTVRSVNTHEEKALIAIHIILNSSDPIDTKINKLHALSTDKNVSEDVQILIGEQIISAVTQHIDTLEKNRADTKGMINNKINAIWSSNISEIDKIKKLENLSSDSSETDDVKFLINEQVISFLEKRIEEKEAEDKSLDSRNMKQDKLMETSTPTPTQTLKLENTTTSQKALEATNKASTIRLSNKVKNKPANTLSHMPPTAGDRSSMAVKTSTHCVQNNKTTPKKAHKTIAVAPTNKPTDPHKELKNHISKIKGEQKSLDGEQSMLELHHKRGMLELLKRLYTKDAEKTLIDAAILELRSTPNGTPKPASHSKASGTPASYRPKSKPNNMPRPASHSKVSGIPAYSRPKSMPSNMSRSASHSKVSGIPAYSRPKSKPSNMPRPASHSKVSGIPAPSRPRAIKKKASI
ncbi:MAG: hypothetical protein PUP46_05080 [Endozoicomonas sp. (ex Botrylloides leachii)]|nr:hypothetical protein [Endozoicomonas sp. (ex Botrylloides leachii)]